MTEDALTREEADAAAAMLTRFVDSWNRADGASYGDGYWPDAELVDPTGSIWNGQTAIAQMHVELWKTIFEGSSVRGAIRRARRLAPHLLLVDLDLELSGFAMAPPGVDVSGGAIKCHLKHILEERSGGWKILAAQNTFVAAPPPSGPPSA